MSHVSAECRTRPPWVAALKRFEQPDTRKAALQIADTLLPYLALLALMYLTVLWKTPYFVTFLLAIPAMQSILPFISEPLPALFSGLCATCSV